MKTLILSLFISASCLAQLQVKEAAKYYPVGKIDAGMQFSKLEYTIRSNDTVYLWIYKNENYPHIQDMQSMSFSGAKNTLNDLYSVIMSCFDDANKNNADYSLDVKLGALNIKVSKYKYMATTYAKIHTENGYCTLNKHQVNKLFGKK